MLSAPAVTVRVSEHGSSSARTTESTGVTVETWAARAVPTGRAGASSAKENVDAESRQCCIKYGMPSTNEEKEVKQW
ncbi:MAG: hypothetical protein ACLT76_10420 [Clostridium fessum]